MTNGFIIAAPHSGSGKTTVTLGVLRATKRRGIGVGPAKAGPDFIDPVFHATASGKRCINLDPWAMRKELVRDLAADQQAGGTLVVEAMMGLFDGAADGTGSAADLAELLNLPVVLVVDAAKQSHSIAALVSGFQNYRDGLDVAGVILNRVGSPRHEAMLREALGTISMPVVGAVPRDGQLVLPERHLGLVQADEHVGLEAFVEHAADVMDACLDWGFLGKLTRTSAEERSTPCLAPLGQHIAVARDRAFAFAYPHLLDGWKKQGAELSFFSPLLDEAPDANCGAVFLPGGYPELHAGRLASNKNFMNGLRTVAEGGSFVYGECGGYMVLGEGLVDAEGVRHEMANLLPLVTSFENRKLHLGYRLATPLSPLPFAPSKTVLTAHEFHYSTIVREGKADRLFKVEDARGEDLGSSGLRIGSVAGSYMHLIDSR